MVDIRATRDKRNNPKVTRPTGGKVYSSKNYAPQLFGSKSKTDLSKIHDQERAVGFRGNRRKPDPA
jgi:hypothetical protein